MNPEVIECVRRVWLNDQRPLPRAGALVRIAIRRGYLMKTGNRLDNLDLTWQGVQLMKRLKEIA